jgi:hypothetical protein
MAWTTVKSGGWLKSSETTAIADTSDGNTSLNDSSILSVVGAGRVLVKADEDATATVGISAKLYYTMDDALNGAIGGVGADPSSPGASEVTWVEAEVGGALSDNLLAAVNIPENARRVKVEYSAAPVGADISSHAGMGTEIWVSGLDSSEGFDIEGIGADPS